MSQVVRKPVFGVQTQTVQPQKMVRGLKFWIYQVEELYYLVVKTKAMISWAVTVQLICAFVFIYPNIRITCPCNEHPLTPHFYIEKVGFTRVYIFFLFLLQNIDCGYSLEPPR